MIVITNTKAIAVTEPSKTEPLEIRTLKCLVLQCLVFKPPLYKTYKSCQKNEVKRGLFPLDVERNKEDHAEDESDHDEPGVGVDQALDSWVEQADTSHQGRHSQLYRQQAVNFTKKSHSKKRQTLHGLKRFNDFGCRKWVFCSYIAKVAI